MEEIQENLPPWDRHIEAKWFTGPHSNSRLALQPCGNCLVQNLVSRFSPCDKDQVKGDFKDWMKTCPTEKNPEKPGTERNVTGQASWPGSSLAWGGHAPGSSPLGLIPGELASVWLARCLGGPCILETQAQTFPGRNWGHLSLPGCPYHSIWADRSDVHHDILPPGAPLLALSHRKPAETWADDTCPAPVCTAIRWQAGRLVR